MNYLVDSDWVIDRLAGRAVAVQLLAALRSDGLAISAITFGEVFEGIDGSGDPVTAAGVFRQFLIGVPVLPLDESIARLFFRVRRALRRSGTPLDDMDLQIAATALHHDLTLVTRNRRHFDRVPGLRLHQ